MKIEMSRHVRRAGQVAYCGSIGVSQAYRGGGGGGGGGGGDEKSSTCTTCTVLK